MSLTTSIDPTEGVFIENPVYLSVETTSMMMYNIMHCLNFEYRRSLFTGNGNGSSKINIAEILETVFEDIPVLNGSSDTLIGLSSGWYNKATIIIIMQNEEAETATLVLAAWRGGISKRASKKSHEEGNNIFSSKFLNESCNFFFTARNNDWRITIRETKLYPLCFIYPEHELRITELLTGRSLAVPGRVENFCALNLEAVRLRFFTDYGVPANLFDVYNGDTLACRTGIEQSLTVRERYRLRFLNNYGVYELSSLEGEASVTPGIDEDEDAVFRRYDEITDDYYSDHIRTEIQEAVTIKTGFRRPQEIHFLLDLLSSDDVYLSGYGQEEIKVISPAEEFSYRVRPDVPQNVMLKLTFVKKGSSWTGEITESSYWKPRIYSKEFSKQFN